MQTSERRRNLVSRDEILDLGDYERRRDEIRQRAIAARALRRIELGPNATLAFENRETVVYQIQEMLRAERIARDEEVRHEIATYTDLLPSPNELSATLMFEFPASDERSVHLAELVGFEDDLRLEVEGAGGAKACFDRRQIDEDKLSAVQFIRFPLTGEQLRAIVAGARLQVMADHPRYRHTRVIPDATARALAADLAEASNG
jgi:Protein of unknown function (DUF3501)